MPSAFQSCFGPPSGQAANKPVSRETPSRRGPRHCGQSGAAEGMSMGRSSFALAASRSAAAMAWPTSAATAGTVGINSRAAVKADDRRQNRVFMGQLLDVVRSLLMEPMRHGRSRLAAFQAGPISSRVGWVERSEPHRGIFRIGGARSARPTLRPCPDPNTDRPWHCRVSWPKATSFTAARTAPSAALPRSVGLAMTTAWKSLLPSE